MKVVCRACKTVCEAAAPDAPAAPCDACGAPLEIVPAGDAAGLEAREGRDPTGARWLALSRPRAPAVRTLFFALAWNAVVASALTVAYLNEGGSLLLLLAIYAAAGLAVLYLGARGLVNHVKFEVGPRRVRVVEGPLPAGHGVEHDSSEVLGFSVAARALEAPGVTLLLREGHAVELPYGFASPAQAAWVAERLQAWLDDAPPSTAYRGPQAAER